MTAKEALDKVKNLLKLHFAADPEPKKFKDQALADGTKLQIEDPEAVGAVINVIAEDGTATPAAGGEYVLEDGRTIIVAEAGIVAEIKEAAPKEEAMAEEPTTPAGGIDWSEEIKWIKQSLASVAKQVATLQTAQSMFADQRKQTAEAFEAIQDFMEIVSTEAPDKPIQKPRQSTFGTQLPDKEAARQKMIAATKALFKKNQK